MVQVFKPLVEASIKITVLGNGEKNKIKAEVCLQILKSHFVFLFSGLFQNCITSVLSGVFRRMHCCNWKVSIWPIAHKTLFVHVLVVGLNLVDLLDDSAI